jgi:hypothetical protein
MDDPFAPLPAPTDPIETARPSFAGRTTSKTSAVRAGVVLGTALIVTIGAAVAMGASSGPSAVGAGPLAAASGSQAPSKEPRGNGFGHGGFGPIAPFRAFVGNGKPDQLPGRAFGKITITAIDGVKLTLGTEDGWTRTITLGASTTITRGGAPATAADLHVGDAIHFRQHREADGSFTISAIDVVLPAVVGTITNVDGSTVTVLAQDGTSVTVHLGATTKLAVRGVKGATAKDLAKGQIALVVGEKRADGSLDATRVLAGTLRAPKPDKVKGPKDQGSRGSSAPSASGQAG